MKLLIKRLIILSIISLFVFNQISCSDEATNNERGTVAVLVVDNDPSETPIPDIENLHHYGG